ncbi:hypothetical protein Hypma_004655 [Hypsizygus marmoreus]|uniref:BTB domain-containing protein n=1 Tax=Hypsizygus marmoreus TaxID=39966 RepID=A0A369J2I7_HYPMA|nr:hypothetical protein Hypma_004655 [Hypsizygus marmoreus]
MKGSLTHGTICPAGHPFDNPKADVILRSSDKPPTDFYVFKLLLSLASPFFDDAFTLPQPPKSDNTTSSIPVINMAEDRRTLELVLGFCYPISIAEPPLVSSLEDLKLAMRAALKFEMKNIQSYLRRVLAEPRFMECQPLRVFAIACHYGWAIEARKAARHTLRYSTRVSNMIVDELELISAAMYHRLQCYQQQCGDAAASHVLDRRIPKSGEEWLWDTCPECPREQHDNVKGSFGRFREEWRRSARPRWLLEWMNAVAMALRDRPYGQTVKSFDLRREALIQANKCRYCSGGADEELDLFIESLAQQVEACVSKIILDLGLEDKQANVDQ